MTLGTTPITGPGILDLSGQNIAISSSGFTLAPTTATINLSSSTINGPGTLTNAPGSTLVLRNTVVNAPLANQGVIVSFGTASAINGTFTTTSASSINLTSNDTDGYAYLTFANGFTNNGAIIFGNNSSSGYITDLTITTGAVTNSTTGTITATVVGATAGRVATLSGSLSNQGGKITVGANADLKITSSITLGTTTIIGPGILDLTGQAIAISSGGFTLAPTTATINFSSSTITGPGTLTNAPGSTLVLRNTVVNAPLANQGVIVSFGTASAINGTFTTTSASSINLTSNDTDGYAYLTFANGFTNNGAIIFGNNSSSGYITDLTITTGAVTNSTTGTITTTVVGAAAGRVATLSGSLSNQGGKITVGANADLKITSSVTLGTTTIIGPGILDLTGQAIAISSGGFTYGPTTATINFSSATINGPGTLTNAPGATLVLRNTVVNATFVNQGTLASYGTASSITGLFTTVAGSTISLSSNDTDGYAYLTIAKSFTNNGTIILSDNSSSGYITDLVVTGGTLTNAASALIVSTGQGAAAGQVNNIGASVVNSGTLAVSFGLTIAGAYTQASTGSFALTIGSPGATIQGVAKLAGLLDLYVPSGYKLTLGQSYPVMTYTSRSGDFTALDGNNVPGFALSKVAGATSYAVKAGPAPADTVAPTISAFTPSTPVNGRHELYLQHHLRRQSFAGCHDALQHQREGDRPRRLQPVRQAPVDQQDQRRHPANRRLLNHPARRHGRLRQQWRLYRDPSIRQRQGHARQRRCRQSGRHLHHQYPARPGWHRLQ